MHLEDIRDLPDSGRARQAERLAQKGQMQLETLGRQIQGNCGLARPSVFQIHCLSEVTGLAFSLTDMGGSLRGKCRVPWKQLLFRGKNRGEKPLLQLFVVCPQCVPPSQHEGQEPLCLA